MTGRTKEHQAAEARLATLITEAGFRLYQFPKGTTEPSIVQGKVCIFVDPGYCPVPREGAQYVLAVTPERIYRFVLSWPQPDGRWKLREPPTQYQSDEELLTLLRSWTRKPRKR